MLTLVAGAVVLVLTAIVFVTVMPRGGAPHRFVGTELEPYVAVLFTAFIALSLTLLLSGTIELIGR